MPATTKTIRMVVFDDPDVALSQRMLTAVRDLATQRGDIDVEHVDVWQDLRIAMAHGVMTVPTTIIFLGSEERKRLYGLRSGRFLTRTIDRIMAEQSVPARDRPAIRIAPAA